MIALDGALDANRRRLTGRIDAERVRTPTLDAAVRRQGDDAYDTPGARPNGSDYVRLRGGSGAWLDAVRAGSAGVDGDDPADDDLDDDGRRASLVRYAVAPGDTLRLSRRALRRHVRDNNEIVGAIVTPTSPPSRSSRTRRTR